MEIDVRERKTTALSELRKQLKKIPITSGFSGKRTHQFGKKNEKCTVLERNNYLYFPTFSVNGFLKNKCIDICYLKNEKGRKLIRSLRGLRVFLKNRTRLTRVCLH